MTADLGKRGGQTGQMLMGRKTPNAVYKHILSGGDMTSPADNLRLTGMYLQRTSPNNVFGG